MATADQIVFTTAVIKNQYPQYAAYMQIPDLANAITDALMRGATPAEIQGAIYATPWYQNTPQTARDFTLFLVGDRVSAETQIAQKADEYITRLGQLGVPYDVNQVRDFAKFQLMTGTSEQRMMFEMVAHFSNSVPLGTSPLQMPGVIGDNMSNVKASAYDYGIKISDDQARFFATGLVTGAATQETVNDFMRDQAKMVFPFMADYLDQGYTVRQWADPYIQSAASELEINPNTIDLTNPQWGRVLQPYQGAPLSLYDWQRVIRTDPAYGWDKTLGARTTAAQLATQFAKTFGAMGG